MANPTHLLLIEDNDFQRHKMKAALIKAGYTVTTARSLSEAYDKVCIPQLPYAAILCDYQLGSRRQTGKEVWQAVRAGRHAIPFIGSSSKMEGWQEIADYGEDPLFHAIPKTSDEQWDDHNVLAKLAELGITP